MSDGVEIPEWVLARVGALTLEQESARRHIGELERQLAELQEPLDEKGPE